MLGSPHHVHFLSLLFALATVRSAQAISDNGVEFTVARVATDTVGGQIFMNKMGVDYAERFMSSITTQIWKSVFGHRSSICRKVKKISLFIGQTTAASSSRHMEDHAYEIYLSSNHLEQYKDFVHEEIPMLLVYEIARVLQYTVIAHIPEAYKDGIAAYVVIHFDRAPSRWAKFGDGDTWDQRPDVTGQFFYYCNSTYDHFIENLHKKIQASYNYNCFFELTGRNIHDVWNDYKSQGQRSKCMLC